MVPLPVLPMALGRTVFLFRSKCDRWGGTVRAATARFALLLIVGALSACADSSGSPPRRLADSAVSAVDDAGRTVRLSHPARRVVSLIPSGTETLFALGAGSQVVGRTKYDVAPEMLHLPSVGGGLDPSLEALVALRPDLVVSWEEGKSRGLRQRLEQLGIPVFAIRTRDTVDVFRNVERLGQLVGRDTSAQHLNRSLRRQLAEVRVSVGEGPRPSVMYVVWTDPPMTVGPRTFIAQLVEIAGGRILFPDVEQDWPTVAIEEIVRRQPDVVVLPIGETRAHSVERLRDDPGWRSLSAVRQGRVVQVPADLMNRPGPHIGEAARVMRDALRSASGAR